MPDMVSVTWDAGSVRAMERAMRAEIDVMGKEPAEVVKHAFIMFGKSGRNATRRGRRLRSIFPNPDARQRTGRPTGTSSKLIAARRQAHGRKDDPPEKWGRYIIQYLYQRRAPKFVATNSRSDPRRRIGRQHLAHKTWGLMMRAVFTGMPFDWPTRYRVRPEAVQHVSDRTAGGTNPAVEFVDKLVYLLKLHPSIGQHAMRAAANKMQHMIDSRLRSDMLRVWHS